MTDGVGVPAEAVAPMRGMPFWSGLEVVAHTLPYDAAIMADTMSGSPLPAVRWASVTIPTLVADGDASPAWARNAVAALWKRCPMHGVVSRGPDTRGRSRDPRSRAGGVPGRLTISLWAMWPDGMRCAAAFTFDFDAEEAWLGEDPANADRPGVLSQGTYGAKWGVPLVLELLAQQHPALEAPRHGHVVDALDRVVFHQHHGGVEPQRAVDAARGACAGEVLGDELLAGVVGVGQPGETSAW